MKVAVLRLGHRIFRDQRITSHVFLAARALGAGEGFYTGQRDQDLESSLAEVAGNWGGSFRVSYLESPRKLLESFPGKIAHLTVYGMPFEKSLGQLKKERSLLVVVGGEKVPPEVYEKADYNLSVGQQPHSEVAAIGILLHTIHGFRKSFPNARLKVVPQERGKKVISRGGKA